MYYLKAYLMANHNKTEFIKNINDGLSLSFGISLISKEITISGKYDLYNIFNSLFLVKFLKYVKNRSFSPAVIVLNMKLYI